MHVEFLLLEGEFDRTFRMQPASLEKLLQKLAPSLLKSTPHNGTFGVEFVKPETVMMALRWLAGGNYGDIRLLAGCSVMSLFGFCAPMASYVRNHCKHVRFQANVGGNYGDIRLVVGCSVMSLFRLLWQVIFAIFANMSDFRRMLVAIMATFV